ncbi:response regulator [Candidatus Woesearchaeota archaeon]|nr:response regulator [Candidatus Woesearchaeota archaeon]
MKTIMVVDDEPEDLKTMKSVLEKEGYNVVTAEGGVDFLKLITHKDFDMVLLDIRMPKLSGYDLSRLLRKRLNRKIKIIYVTIVPEKEVAMNNIDGFIQKPFSPESLLDGVKKALGEKIIRRGKK